MRHYYKARQRLHHWLLILKPGQCMEFSPVDFDIKAETAVAYVEDINRLHVNARFKTCSTGKDTIGVRRLVDAGVENG